MSATAMVLALATARVSMLAYSRRLQHYNWPYNATQEEIARGIPSTRATLGNAQDYADRPNTSINVTEPARCARPVVRVNGVTVG